MQKLTNNDEINNKLKKKLEKYFNEKTKETLL